MINLALVSGVVRGSGGTGWSEWLGRSGGWDGEVVGLVRVDWVVRVARVVKPGCYACVMTCISVHLYKMGDTVQE